jgi:hypothetical protein
LSWKRTKLIWINFSSGKRAIRHKTRFAQAPSERRSAADCGQRGEAAGASGKEVARGGDQTAKPPGSETGGFAFVPKPLSCTSDDSGVVCRNRQPT